MVDLPGVPRRLVTSEAPSMRADPGAGLVALGRGVSTLGAAVTDLAKQQKDALDARTEGQLNADMTRRSAELQAQHLNDPLGYDREFGAYVQELANRQDQSTRVRDFVARSGSAERQRTYGGMVIRAGDRLSRENSAAILANIGMEEDRIKSLAGSGQTESPEFAESLGKIRRWYGDLEKNPTLIWTPEQTAAKLTTLDTEARAEAIVGAGRRYFNETGDLIGAQRQAEEQLGKLTMDPSKRLQLLGEISRHMASVQAVRREELQGWRDRAKSFESGLKAGQPWDDKAIDETIDALKSRRDYAGAAGLEASRIAARSAPLISGGTVDQAVDTMRRLRGQPDLAAVPRVTAYSPQRNGDQMEGGYAASTAGPDGQAVVRTLDDFAAGRSGYVTVAGNPAFYGRRYTIPEITYRGADGQERTLKNVPAVVHDTGAAFKGAPEGRFDVAVSRDLPADATSKQPFLSRGVQFVSEGGAAVGSRPAAGQKMTADNWTLKFYKPEDMLAPTAGGRQVDARAATMADELGQKFFAATGVRVGINDLRKWGPGESTGGMRRGAADPADNPHVENSQHIHGAAFDFQIQGLSRDQKALFFKMAREIGFTGVGFYEGGAGHIHLDTGSDRTWGGVPEWARDGMAIRPAGGGQGSAAVSGGGAAVAARQTPAGGVQVASAATLSPEFAAAQDAAQKLYDARTRELWSGMKSAWDKGQKPTAEEFDGLQKLFGMVADRGLRQDIYDGLRAHSADAEAAGLPVTALETIARETDQAAARGELPPAGRAIAEQIAETTKRRKEQASRYPVSYAMTALAPEVADRVPPLDVSSPNMLAAGLALRTKTLGIIKRADPAAGDNPLMEGEAGAIATALTNGDARTALAVTTALGTTLTPAQIAAAAKVDETLKAALVGLTISGDPDKMAAGFALLDKLDRENPEYFRATFGESLQKRLDVWMAQTKYFPPKEIVEQMKKDADPTYAAARAKLRADARDKVGAMSAAEITAAFTPAWTPNFLFGASPPEGTESAALANDFREVFSEYASRGLNDDEAKRLAVKRLGEVWGPSAANGGRLMRYPPERYAPEISRSNDYVRAQLERDVETELRQLDVLEGDRFRVARRLTSHKTILITDARTQNDVSGGRQPSYQVAVIVEGRHHLLLDSHGNPLRWRADPAAVRAAETKASIDDNPAAQQTRSLAERWSGVGFFGGF